jgi:hypothetical protein
MAPTTITGRKNDSRNYRKRQEKTEANHHQLKANTSREPHKYEKQSEGQQVQGSNSKAGEVKSSVYINATPTSMPVSFGQH